MKSTQYYLYCQNNVECKLIIILSFVHQMVCIAEDYLNTKKQATARLLAYNEINVIYIQDINTMVSLD